MDKVNKKEFYNRLYYLRCLAKEDHPVITYICT